MKWWKSCKKTEGGPSTTGFSENVIYVLPLTSMLGFDSSVDTKSWIINEVIQMPKVTQMESCNIFSDLLHWWQSEKELIERFVVNITPEVFIDFPHVFALILPPSIHVIQVIIQIISDQCLVVYCLSTRDKSLTKLYLKDSQQVLIETVKFVIRNLTFPSIGSPSLQALFIQLN